MVTVTFLRPAPFGAVTRPATDTKAAVGPRMVILPGTVSTVRVFPFWSPTSVLIGVLPKVTGICVPATAAALAVNLSVNSSSIPAGIPPVGHPSPIPKRPCATAVLLSVLVQFAGMAVAPAKTSVPKTPVILSRFGSQLAVRLTPNSVPVAVSKTGTTAVPPALVDVEPILRVRAPVPVPLPSVKGGRGVIAIPFAAKTPLVTTVLVKVTGDPPTAAPGRTWNLKRTTRFVPIETTVGGVVLAPLKFRPIPMSPAATPAALTLIAVPAGAPGPTVMSGFKLTPLMPLILRTAGLKWILNCKPAVSLACASYSTSTNTSVLTGPEAETMRTARAASGKASELILFCALATPQFEALIKIKMERNTKLTSVSRDDGWIFGIFYPLGTKT